MGALGGALGGLWGVNCPQRPCGGQLPKMAKSVLRAWGGLGGSMGVPGGSLGAPWGVLGGPWGVPGRSQATFWAPRSAPDDKGAHPGGSLGGSRRAEKSPETIFLRSQEGKCVYFQGFKHVHFVDLMWPLGAPGPPWGDLGRPWGRQGWSWGSPGGVPGGNGSPLGRSGGVPRYRVPPQGGSRGGPRKPKRAFWSGSGFSRGAKIVVKIGIPAIFGKMTFFCHFHLRNSWGWPKRAPRRVFGAQEASQEPSYFPGSALATSEGGLQKIDQAHGGPFWGVLDRLKYAKAQNLMVKPS